MRKTLLLIAILLLLLGLSFMVCLCLGGSALSMREVWQALIHPEQSGADGTIIWRIRLPRVIIGFFVGAGLAVCGAVLQGMLRNPLAEPYTLGVSGGAAFGATLGIVLGFSGNVVTGTAFGGALCTISLVYIIASRRKFSMSALILGGVILSFVFSSLVLLIFALARAEEVHGALLWLMGDLSSVQPALPMFVVAGAIIIGFVILLLYSRDLNVITLGEEKAAHLGVELGKVKRILFLTTALIAGASVAVSGIIGFVGLIVPHFLRKLVGPNHQILLPAAALGGAIFLSLSDALARSIVAPVELPVGVVTGIVGGIFFLSFLVRSREWEMF